VRTTCRSVFRSVLRRFLPFTAMLLCIGVPLPPALASIEIAPPIPVADQPFVVSRAGLVFGPPVSVFQTTVTIEQQTIDVVAFVDLGSTQEFPTPYLATATVPSQPAGEYLVRVFRRDRTASSGGFGEPLLLETLQISVVAPSNVASAVEYFSVSRDHYFLTANPAEIAALDAGSLPDWVRTGLSFPVHISAPPHPNSVQPTCRYYGLPSAGLDTHFFSSYAPECAYVSVTWPDKWILESPNAFYTYLPFAINGACPNGTQSIFRFYNGRPDVNHRYTTSVTAAQDMLERGWIAEVGMCTAK
jgi:hypothetical protein